LEKARSLTDVGKSGLARSTLRKAAQDMRREEEERRERYALGVTALYNRERTSRWRPMTATVPPMQSFFGPKRLMGWTPQWLPHR
jgi:hypothetical protein